MKAFFFIAWAVTFLSIPWTAHPAEPRVALVLGVWEYMDPTFPALPGIGDDVNNMSAKLKELGFDVTTVRNPTLGEAKKAVDDFGARLRDSKGVGLFYFSGHGCENDGKNYLVPKGTSIRTASDLDDETLSAQRVLTRMEEAGNGVNLVFLDCCRNALTKGNGELAPMRASGTFIGFATGAATEANAGRTGSVYTQVLLKHLGTPGVSITDMHTAVTREVKELTANNGHPQIPFQYSGLDSVYFMVPQGEHVTRMMPIAGGAEAQRNPLKLDIEISPHRLPHTRDATVGYKYTGKEKKWVADTHPDLGKRVGFDTQESDSLMGKVGQQVAWFGIVREIKEEADKKVLTIQHCYYDGLNDYHMQLISANGAGDFQVVCDKIDPELKRLCLVRVIGKVTAEKDYMPSVAANYIRVWRKGDYAFMDYGKDASNEKWTALRKRTGPRVYDPDPDDNYYKAILGD